MGVCSTQDCNESSNVPASEVQAPSQTASTATEPSEKQQVKGLLAEARATRDMLVEFRAAIETGTYHGGKMLAVAKGLAFLEAILNQNQAHLRNLQERLDA